MAVKVCQLCAVDFSLKHFLLPLVDAMDERRWSVTCVCSDSGLVGGLREQGYRIEVVPISRSLNIASHLISLFRLLRLFRTEQFDVLHTHTPIAALIGRIAGRLAGIPLVIYTAHGFYFHDNMPAWKRGLFVLLERFGGLFTDLLFTQSHEDAVSARDERIVPPECVLEIGNGVDTRKFDPRSVADVAEVRKSLGIPKSAFVIGIIGRMVREKGYREFFEAAREVALRVQSVYFLVVGERLASDHAGAVQSDLDLAATNLGERLVAVGYRPDTPCLLAAMDVFCLPSYREGMPRTIIEAMMMGKPVVATNIRGAREEVEDGITGILVPVQDSKALAKAFLRLIADKEYAARLGASGRIRALRLYDEAKVVALQLERMEKHWGAAWQH